MRARKLRLRGIVVASLAIASAASTSAAQTAPPAPLPAYRARVVGVFDSNTGDAIADVEVVDMASGTVAKTTATGTASLAFLPDGGSLVRFRKVGYAPHTQFITISPSDTSALTILLNPTMTTLAPVVTTDSARHYISPGLQGFEERRKQGLGEYFDETELRKADSHELADVLRRVHGLIISCSNRTPRTCKAFSAIKKACPAKVFWNGVPVTDNNLNMYQVAEFGAVEVYSSAAKTPVQFNGTGSECGVILFWSRERF